MRQGEIWLLERPSEKARPALVLTRDAAVAVLTSVTVAPLTSTIRGLPTEVLIGADRQSVASFDNLETVGRAYLTRRLGQIAPGRWHEVCAAMRAALDC